MRIAPLILLAAVCASGQLGAQQLPHPDHVVIVIEENKSFEDVIDPPNTPLSQSRAPYLNGLLPNAALLKASYGLHHPSQPNYLELFSGSNQGVCNDHPPRVLIDAPNLARSFLEAPSLQRRGFVGFAEDLPSDLTTPARGNYVRRHCPWLDFAGIPAEVSIDSSAFPTTADGFANLPAVAIVIPNLIDDMHSPSGSVVAARFRRIFHRNDIPAEVLQGDQWLKDHLGAYADWAMTNNSLLIITWDEDSQENKSRIARLELDSHREPCEHAINTTPPVNHIPTIIVGQAVMPGSTSETTYTHYSLLRTILEMEGLAPLGGSATESAITGIWH